MPGGDRTGPAGLGPMTGRGAGYCAGYGMPGYANPYGGRGFWGRGWFGRGGGRGWRNWRYGAGYMGAWPVYGMPYAGAAGYPYYPYGAGTGMAPQDEMEMLKAQSETLRSQLDQIQERMTALEQAQSEASK